MKKLLIFIFILLPFTVKAESVTLVPLQGVETVFALNTIGKIVVNNDSLSLYSNDGALLAKEYVFDLRKIVFNNPTDMSDIDADKNISITVSADETILFINGLEENTNTDVRLFTPSGQLLSTFHANNTTVTIPINQLQSGTYLLLVGVQPIKFIKH